MAVANQEKKQEEATYLGLMSAFGALVLAFVATKPRGKVSKENNLNALDLGLLGLATYRTGRLIAYDKVTEPLRAAVAQTKEDETEAGEKIEPKGTGVQKALGQLVACPTCSGTWVAAGLVFGLRIAPYPTRVFMSIMATAGLAEMLDTSLEALNWTARSRHYETGVQKKELEQKKKQAGSNGLVLNQ